MANRKTSKEKILEPSKLKVGDLVAFRTREAAFSKLNTSYRFGRIESFLQRSHALDGASRSAYVAYWNQPGDLKDDGQEYDKVGKEVLTLRRIDSLIALDSDENLKKEFEEQSKYLEGLYNGARHTREDPNTDMTTDTIENSTTVKPGVDSLENNEASNNPTTEKTQERPSKNKTEENVKEHKESDHNGRGANDNRSGQDTDTI